MFVAQLLLPHSLETGIRPVIRQAFGSKLALNRPGGPSSRALRY